MVRESRKKVRGWFVGPEKKFVGGSWVQEKFVDDDDGDFLASSGDEIYGLNRNGDKNLL